MTKSLNLDEFKFLCKHRSPRKKKARTTIEDRVNEQRHKYIVIKSISSELIFKTQKHTGREDCFKVNI